jgi:hypothetical protein
MKTPLPVRPALGPFAPIAEPEGLTPDGRCVLETDEYQTLLSREELVAYIERLRAALEQMPPQG